MAKTMRGFQYTPVLIYIAVVAVIAAGIFAWDYAWRKQEEARRQPPPPQEIAKNLVENIIGQGTVREVKVEKGVVDVTFESATFKPGQAKKESREYLQAELELAITSILGQMQEISRVNATVTYQGKILARGSGEKGKKVEVTYAPELQ
ncbi:MAG: hypothetical protein QN198_10040 [Armatimonadota bacterium]|nr:hypothetical protein [Armatimonadota bacterium]